MAIYEFACKECKLLITEEHPMKDAPSESVCPECDEPIQRYYGSGMNFVLKGDGWPSKNIRQGVSPAANNRLEADMIKRKKMGLKTFDKDVPMSDAEFKRRKANVERFIDETPKN